jgi:uncharacterized protein (DUF1501 family)
MSLRMRRRGFLQLGAALWVMGTVPGLRAAPTAPPKRFVWIILRGALDSLHTVVPVFDRNLAAQRAALFDPIERDLRAIDGGFALHPALQTVHGWYREGVFAPVVAVASPYRERSHFDGQDVLESGAVPANPDHGWLARAAQRHHGEALAIARSVPVVLRGELDTQTWYPSALPEADDDLYQRVLDLYEGDQHLFERLKEGLATRAEAGGMQDDERRGGRRARFDALARSCGELLAKNPEISCAALEIGGWDTHNAQLPRLSQQLHQLDQGLKALRTALGPAWDHTLIALATEFGRTVAVNGTNGTDHGTGSALFLAGGALAGGRVLGEWPGLATKDLYQQRDLRPTSDLRAWIAGALGAHWELPAGALQEVFPGVKPRAESLLRTTRGKAA